MLILIRFGISQLQKFCNIGIKALLPLSVSMAEKPISQSSLGMDNFTVMDGQEGRSCNNCTHAFLCPDCSGNPIYELKKLEQKGSIKDYYEAFDSIRRRVDLREDFLLSWFVAGLRMETRREVRSIRPQTVIQAYAYGRLYELAYPKRHPLPLVPTQKSLLSNSPVLFPISETQDNNTMVVFEDPKFEGDSSKGQQEVCSIEERGNLGENQSYTEILEVSLSDKEIESQDGWTKSLEATGNQGCSLENNFIEDAHQVFDKAPHSQKCKLVGWIEKDDESNAFQKPMLYLSPTMPIEEQYDFKVHEINELKDTTLLLLVKR